MVVVRTMPPASSVSTRKKVDAKKRDVKTFFFILCIYIKSICITVSQAYFLLFLTEKIEK